MPLEAYDYCPCGSNKKIKFCCCGDLLTELNSIMRQVEGDQSAAALEHVKTIIEKNGERDAMLVLEANLEMQSGQLEQANETVKKLLEKAPENAVALALSAVTRIPEEGAIAGVEPMQRAMESIGEVAHAIVFECLEALCQALLMQRAFLPARAHLMLLASAAGDSNQTLLSALARMSQSRDIPLLLKDGFGYLDCPADAPYAAAVDDALKLAQRGCWLKSSEELAEIAAGDGANDPTVWKNLAITRTCVGDNPGAVDAYRRFAAFEDQIDLDDAVEAEATAQLLDPDAESEKVDVKLLRFKVNDVDRLLERLRLNRQTCQMPVDPAMLRPSEDAPPPKAAYFLLDRELPESGKEITRDAVPNVLGDMLLFGRETDRDARLEVAVSHTPDFDEKKAAVIEVGGVHIEPEPEIETLQQVPAIAEAMSWNWHFPTDTPPELQKELTSQQQSHVTLEVWPTLSLGNLDGKTPTEAAADPALKIRLMAAAFVLQLTAEENSWDVDFDALRKKLNLPIPEPIDPTGVDIMELPLVRLERLILDKLSDEELVQVYHRSMANRAVKALTRSAEAVLARDSVAALIDKAEVYATLSNQAGDPETAIELILKAQQTATEKGRSPAQYLLMELAQRFARGDGPDCQRLIQTIQTRHINEPGIAQTFFNMLVQFGVITPDGRPTAAMRQAAAAAGPPAGGPTADGLFTGGAEPTPAAEQKESKIWMPGMD
jgi:tetratricopeptide (TPR) repeat protein